jgi:hypothetical protein
MHSLLSLSFAALVGQCCAQLSLATTPKLNLTALGADKGESTIECWQLDAPFTTSAGAGTAGALALNMGDLSHHDLTVAFTKPLRYSMCRPPASLYKIC